MKKLILAENATTADIENGDFIGVHWGGKNAKGIIVRGRDGDYTSLGSGLDSHGHWRETTKRRYAEEALRLDKATVIYKFETFKELTDWWSS